MINFLLDLDVFFSLAIWLLLIVVIGVLVNRVVFLVISLPISVFITVIMIFSVPQFKENENLFKELFLSYYNFNINEHDTHRFGFHLCNISDYKIQACKNYIEYFVAEKLTNKREKERRESKEMEETMNKMEQRVDEKNKLKENIEQILRELGMDERNNP